MNQQETKTLRGILFRHLDGIALCGTISALNSQGITKFILKLLQTAQLIRVFCFNYL